MVASDDESQDYVNDASESSMIEIEEEAPIVEDVNSTAPVPLQDNRQDQVPIVTGTNSTAGAALSVGDRVKLRTRRVPVRFDPADEKPKKPKRQLSSTDKKIGSRAREHRESTTIEKLRKKIADLDSKEAREQREKVRQEALRQQASGSGNKKRSMESSGSDEEVDRPSTSRPTERKRKRATRKTRNHDEDEEMEDASGEESTHSEGDETEHVETTPSISTLGRVKINLPEAQASTSRGVARRHRSVPARKEVVEEDDEENERAEMSSRRARSTSVGSSRRGTMGADDSEPAFKYRQKIPAQYAKAVVQYDNLEYCVENTNKLVYYCQKDYEPLRVGSHVFTVYEDAQGKGVEWHAVVIGFRRNENECNQLINHHAIERIRREEAEEMRRQERSAARSATKKRVSWVEPVEEENLALSDEEKKKSVPRRSDKRRMDEDLYHMNDEEPMLLDDDTAMVDTGEQVEYDTSLDFMHDSSMADETHGVRGEEEELRPETTGSQDSDDKGSADGPKETREGKRGRLEKEERKKRERDEEEIRKTAEAAIEEDTERKRKEAEAAQTLAEQKKDDTSGGAEREARGTSQQQPVMMDVDDGGRTGGGRDATTSRPVPPSPSAALVQQGAKQSLRVGPKSRRPSDPRLEKQLTKRSQMASSSTAVSAVTGGGGGWAATASVVPWSPAPLPKPVHTRPVYSRPELQQMLQRTAAAFAQQQDGGASSSVPPPSAASSSVPRPVPPSDAVLAQQQQKQQQPGGGPQPDGEPKMRLKLLWDARGRLAIGYYDEAMPELVGGLHHATPEEYMFLNRNGRLDILKARHLQRLQTLQQRRQQNGQAEIITID